MPTIEIDGKEYSGDKLYRNETVLRELYVARDLGMEEVADMLGCSKRTVYVYTNEFSLTKRHRDEEVLRELYIEHDLSIKETARELGKDRHTVSKALDDFGIEKDGESKYRRKAHLSKPVPYFSYDGYRLWQHSVGNNESPERVFVHRLLAVSEYGLEAIAGEDVHHKNNHRFDNRPENIEIKTRSDHSKEHNPRHFTEPEAEEIRERYARGDCTQYGLSEEYGVSQPLIEKVLSRRGGYGD